MTSRQSAANDLLRAAARLNRWASQAAAFDVPYAQARLLALIDEMQPVRISALAEADHSSQPTVTTQVQRMETAGWVLRQTDPDDARATLVSLSPAGAQALDEVRAARAQVLDPALDRLDGPALERVHAAVSVMTELLELASSTASRKDS
ncbi:MarR family transcriptional regulator [Intrasporangium chromatireducens Q5-1]|uniref:MarR family transcriptional regulator n=1 Tax=Intrasporangium chromatireducens Q5-1 TaxID=584657 RepID=W9GQP5_9MICO|nr:MarR family transcriptional regulator [Intrasporangium chromatireducens]EWT07392.1 MarR family transcriptional regulator [Intrasporangium chromatireducens Q5-1]